MACLFIFTRWSAGMHLTRGKHMVLQLILPALRFAIPGHYTSSSNFDEGVITVKLPRRGQSQRLLMHIAVCRITRRWPFKWMGYIDQVQTEVTVNMMSRSTPVYRRTYDYPVHFDGCVDAVIETLESDYSWLNQP